MDKKILKKISILLVQMAAVVAAGKLILSGLNIYADKEIYPKLPKEQQRVVDQFKE